MDSEREIEKKGLKEGKRKALERGDRGRFTASKTERKRDQEGGREKKERRKDRGRERKRERER